MRCICKWGYTCAGTGFVHCLNRGFDCYCSCGCKEECYGCSFCEGDDDEKWCDEEDPTELQEQFE